MASNFWKRPLSRKGKAIGFAIACGLGWTWASILSPGEWASFVALLIVFVLGGAIVGALLRV